MKKLSSISVILPAYNDALSLQQILPKLLRLLPKVASDFEIIIVNDGSKDNTQEVLEAFKKTDKRIKIVVHPTNQGYGAALSDGFESAAKEFIFYTDSDGQYDVDELVKLVSLMDTKVDIVTGFKLNRSDSWERKILGGLYNQMVKRLLGLKVKDVDCDFRLFRKKLLRFIPTAITSGGFDAAFVKALEQKKANFKEVGIYHYPRIYGTSQFFTPLRIAKSIIDVLHIWYYYRRYE